MTPAPISSWLWSIVKSGFGKARLIDDMKSLELLHEKLVFLLK